MVASPVKKSSRALKKCTFHGTKTLARFRTPPEANLDYWPPKCGQNAATLLVPGFTQKTQITDTTNSHKARSQTHRRWPPCRPTMRHLVTDVGPQGRMPEATRRIGTERRPPTIPLAASAISCPGIVPNNAGPSGYKRGTKKEQPRQGHFSAPIWGPQIITGTVNPRGGEANFRMDLWTLFGGDFRGCPWTTVALSSPTFPRCH